MHLTSLIGRLKAVRKWPIVCRQCCARIWAAHAEKESFYARANDDCKQTPIETAFLLKSELSFKDYLKLQVTLICIIVCLPKQQLKNADMKKAWLVILPLFGILFISYTFKGE